MSIKRVTFTSILMIVILIIIGIGIGIAGSNKLRVANEHFYATPSLHVAELWVPSVHHASLHVHQQLHQSHVDEHVVTNHLSRLDVHELS